MLVFWLGMRNTGACSGVYSRLGIDGYDVPRLMVVMSILNSDVSSSTTSSAGSCEFRGSLGFITILLLKIPLDTGVSLALPTYALNT